MSKQLTIYCDGLCEPNPGLGTWAFIVFDEKGQSLYSDQRVIKGHTTNNVAEYYAVGSALRWVCENEPGADVELLTDSYLVVQQVKEAWACNQEHLQELRDRCQARMNGLNIRLGWISGKDNPADSLTRFAYFRETGRMPPARSKREKVK